MNTYFLEQVHNFVDEFYHMYNLDQYISKRMIDSFFDKYDDIIKLSNKYNYNDDKKYKLFRYVIDHGYYVIKIKNEKYIDAHLQKEKDYFDNIFKDIDSNIVLDDEQRRAILVDEDYSLIIAGAGSGKTTTMAAKVKYLIEKKNVNPKSIILLSFTNKSVNDLNDLINNKFRLNVEVLTFHKLGMKFLRNMYDKPFEIVSDAGAYKVISDYFLNVVFKDKVLLKKYLDIFSKYLYLDEECLKFDNFDAYYKYYMDIKYDLCKNNLKEEIRKRIKNRSRYLKTINGEFVKSDGELRIANYLYTHKISYKYEMVYPFSVDGNRSYKPDFTINDMGTPIYVEYYGLASLKNDGTYFSADKEYEKQIGIKRRTHKKNSTDLIELYSSGESGYYFLKTLSYELTKRNVYKHKLSEKEIFYRLLETSKTYMYTRLIQLFIVFINIYKEKGYIESDFDVLQQKCDDEIVKLQLECIRNVYCYYQKTIHMQYKVDFQDMIHYAYTNMKRLKEKNRFLDYKYVVVDEYQDISFQRYNFIRKISDLFRSKIVAVGDDWQTIYSFSGSDIDLFTNFCDVMGYGEEVQITNTYRNSQELIDLAGDFILKNSFQIDKKLHSNKHLLKPVKMIEYEYNDDTDELAYRLEELLIKIYNEHPNDNILLLSRFNIELNYLLDSKLFYKTGVSKDSIICKAIPNAKIDILTVHKSKGLGYDRVILLNAIDGLLGFPSQIKDQPVIKYLKTGSCFSDGNFEPIEYPEERRLFYVALTRTKNELYIMVPSLYQYRSDFIKEILDNENVEVVE